MTVIFKGAGLVLLSLIGVFLVLFGILYATVSDYLPFHAAAVEDAALGPAKQLYIALMTLIGGASGALGLLGLYVTWGPIRRGEPVAALSVAAAYIIAFLSAAVTAERLAAKTGAPTSFHIMAILIAITLAGLIASLIAPVVGRAKEARS